MEITNIYNKLILENITQSNQLAGDFIEALTNKGYSQGWKEFIDIIGDDKTINWDDVADVAEWIKGSKTNDNYEDNEPPEDVQKTLVSLIN